MQLRPLDSLPTTFTRSETVSVVDDNLTLFLEGELDLSRLDKIQHLLWMTSNLAKRNRVASIHLYQVVGYNIHGVQRMDLHLVRDRAPLNRLMVKPLPEWILSYDFWNEHLCGDEYMHASACGFLVSYIWLIQTPLDIKIAHDHMLLPPFITWYWWRAFTKEVASTVDLNGLHYVSV